MISTRYLRRSVTYCCAFALTVAAATACGDSGDGPAGGGAAGVGGAPDAEPGVGGDTLGGPSGGLGGEGAGGSASAGLGGGGATSVGLGGGDVGGGGGDAIGAGGVPEVPEVPEDYLKLHRSGSRLVVQVLRAPGAPDRFERLYDQELEVPCKAGKLENGRWYCLPQLPDGLTFLGYADEDCESPVYELRAGCSDVPQYVTQAVNGCSSSFEVQVLAPASAAGSLYARTGESCNPSGSSYAKATSLVASGLAGPDDFVELKREAAPTRGALSVLLERGADGSQAATQLVDVTSGFVCDAAFDLAPASCRPTRRAFPIGLFDDDACTMPRNYAYASTPAACDEVDVIESDGYFLPGEEVTAEVWTKLTGECESRTQHPFLRHLREIGAKFEGELGQYDSSRSGEGRLAVPLLSESSTPLVPARVPYFDQERQRDCEPKVVDGSLRCLPAGFDLREINPDLTRYADALCTQPLFYCATGNCLNEVYYDATQQDACTGSPTYPGMRRLLAPVTGTVYQKEPGGACAGPIEASPVWTSEPLGASDFERVERVTL
jgi:hypothetical protein